MSKILFAPMVDTPGKHDAGEFQREAHAFCKEHTSNCGVRLFDNRLAPPQRFSQVVDWLHGGNVSSLADTIAFFCHGYKTGLQFGATMQNAEKMADAIKVACVSSPKVILYACSAGRDGDADATDEDDPGPGGDGGYADKLRDALGRIGVRATIYAHTTAAHTTRNPFVRRFDPGEMAGGHWVVEPYSRLWGAWREALRGSLRFRFPYLAQDQIEAELEVVGVA
jgi:hypothetical protein